MVHTSPLLLRGRPMCLIPSKVTMLRLQGSAFFFLNDPAPPETYPLPLHDALPIYWARSGTTTKSIVTPPAGRASVGPVMVTSVPPTRITPADRFAMSPPRTSKTRSTPPTSSREIGRAHV